MAPPFRLSLALGALLCVGCSSSSSPEHGSDAGSDAGGDASLGNPACTNVSPASCPSPEPSYATDVVPLFETHCYACHADAGVYDSTSGIDLGSYQAVYLERGAVQTQVAECLMPPATPQGGIAPPPAPSDEERATILGWLKCNAPDN